MPKSTSSFSRRGRKPRGRSAKQRGRHEPTSSSQGPVDFFVVRTDLSSASAIASPNLSRASPTPLSPSTSMLQMLHSNPSSPFTVRVIQPTISSSPFSLLPTPSYKIQRTLPSSRSSPTPNAGLFTLPDPLIPSDREQNTPRSTAPSSTIASSPPLYSKSHVPSVAHLGVLGCKAYVQIHAQNRVLSQKTVPRAEVGFLVGYKGARIYRVYVPTRKGDKIVRSSNVRFDENNLNSTSRLIPLPTTHNTTQLLNNRGGGIEENSQVVKESSPDGVLTFDHEHHATLPKDEVYDNYFEQSDSEASQSESESIPSPDKSIERAESSKSKKSRSRIQYQAPEGPRPTRSNTVLPRDPQALLAYETAYKTRIEATVDLQTVKEALAGKDQENWRKAIPTEYDNYKVNQTWVGVERSQIPSGNRVLGARIVFKTKRDQDGKIEKHRARYVVKGHRQEYGIDNDETCAGVCRSSFWKTLMAMAALHDLEIEHMDAVAAFLKG